MHIKKIFAAVVVVILLGSTVFLSLQYQGVRRLLSEAEEKLGVRATNEKVLAFGQLFVEKVLKAKGEISFNDRLALENAVRGLGNAEIEKRWQEFIDSKTETEAQATVKNLLETLFGEVEAD